MNQEQKRKVVRKAYKPTASREYTDAEVDAEIASLQRKEKEGMLDDFSLHLFCQLDLAPNEGRY